MYHSISFGLCNLPETFQSTTDVVIDKHKFQFDIVYFHNVVVISKTRQPNRDPVPAAHFLQQSVGPHLKSKDFEFFSNTVDHVDHVIRPRQWILFFFSARILWASAARKIWRNCTHFSEFASISDSLRLRFLKIAASIYWSFIKSRATIFNLASNDELWAMENHINALDMSLTMTIPYYRLRDTWHGCVQRTN